MEKLLRNRASVVSTATVSDGRYIYNDLGSDPQSANPGYAVRPNKKAVRRKHSTFNIVSLLFFFAIICLLYTSNVITVNQLAKEVNDLTIKYNAIANANELLKVEINRKSNIDRISSLATEELGMINPKEPPVWFEINREKLNDINRNDNARVQQQE
jgi:cell division protein FtsB